MSESSAVESNVDMRLFQGKTLRGNYLLKEYIREGSFGAVFLSEQWFLDIPVRRVAVKLSKHTDIDVDTARDIFADAFLLAQAVDEMPDAEARNHLVHVYDVGLLPEMDNRAFIVMEYVQGTTLAAQFASHSRIPANLLLKWTCQMCQALTGLHTLVPPVIHRDLKPDNVLLGMDRNVRVVDFGLAAKLRHYGYVPGVAGTTTYMAPETRHGQSIPASDVYSIGLMLYEGLTGQLPFAHLVPPTGLPERLYDDWRSDQENRVQPIPPSALNNTVTPQLDCVVLQCLCFKPSDRYHNAGELLEELNKPTADQGPPDVFALNEGRRLKIENDLDEARQAVERGLAAASSSKEIRFALMCESAEILTMMGDHRAVASRLTEAWELAKDSALLRTRQERADLLNQIAIAYRLSSNAYQAKRFEDLSAKELQTPGRGGHR